MYEDIDMRFPGADTSAIWTKDQKIKWNHKGKWIKGWSRSRASARPSEMLSLSMLPVPFTAEHSTFLSTNFRLFFILFVLFFIFLDAGLHVSQVCLELAVLETMTSNSWFSSFCFLSNAITGTLHHLWLSHPFEKLVWVGSLIIKGVNLDS